MLQFKQSTNNSDIKMFERTKKSTILMVEANGFDSPDNREFII